MSTEKSGPFGGLSPAEASRKGAAVREARKAEAEAEALRGPGMSDED